MERISWQRFIADSCKEARHISLCLNFLNASNFQTDPRDAGVPQGINQCFKKNEFNQVSLGNIAHQISLSETLVY